MIYLGLLGLPFVWCFSYLGAFFWVELRLQINIKMLVLHREDDSPTLSFLFFISEIASNQSAEMALGKVIFSTVSLAFNSQRHKKK